MTVFFCLINTKIATGISLMLLGEERMNRNILPYEILTESRLRQGICSPCPCSFLYVVNTQIITGQNLSLMFTKLSFFNLCLLSLECRGMTSSFNQKNLTKSKEGKTQISKIYKTRGRSNLSCLPRHELAQAWARSGSK